MEKLLKYQSKRNFDKTSEPSGKIDRTKSRKKVFAVQHHIASHDHFDFRLEWGGVLISFAVPKGISYNPKDKRLAVMVEDHPLDYADFEGVIPKGEYGGGTVMLWDYGTYKPTASFQKGLKEGVLKFELFGKRLKGVWTIVRLEKDPKNWLLIKERDEFALDENGTSNFVTSVKTGRTMTEIAMDEKQKENQKKMEENKEKIEKQEKNKVKTLKKIKKNGKKNPFDEVDVKLCKMMDAVPSGNEYVFEIKYDGFRMVAFTENGETRLITRNHKDFTSKFPEIASAITQLASGRAFVLDGEIIVTDQQGRSDFQALQNHLKGGDAQPVYMVFDLLALEGKDLRNFPLLKRKQLLSDLLKVAPENLKFSDHIVGKGEQFFKLASKLKLEGIVGKVKTSKYDSLRDENWVKCKCYNRQEFVIAGYDFSDKKELSSLILGAYENGSLNYFGRAGTGLDKKITEKLLKMFEKLRTKRTYLKNFPLKDENVVWLKPKLVAEIQYAELTKEHLLRQASFKGLREDKKAREVVFEGTKVDVKDESEEETNVKNRKYNSKQNESTSHVKKSLLGLKDDAKNQSVEKNDKKTSKNSVQTAQNYVAVEKIGKSSKKNLILDVEISNPNRVVFKKPKTTKMEVAQYYEKVSKRMLQYISRRVLSVVRCHALKDSFFKKHPMENEDVERVEVENEEGKTEEYFYVDSAQQLVKQVQLGTIEFHAWGSHVKTLESPDMMVFDFDPDEKLGLERVRQGVKDLKKILDGLKLRAFLKTSGGKGYHVVVPFVPKADWNVFHDFAESVAHLMESKWPERYTTNIRKESRQGKIFVDFMRNTRGATSVAPYSLRAREGAKVSMPISWNELDKIAPNEINAKSALERIEKPDPWRDFFKVKQNLKTNK